eukprot:TRINITY_DN1192_c0_g1_i3.p1 TRINITY_DN1192_c0_g1~~TRINITY_DN1192_c0_g1_i3.p1  ORF type:complete len:322 (+),score=38.11 TRINITY_DN1192_c0_g1_i3:191-1156(+)
MVSIKKIFGNIALVGIVLVWVFESELCQVIERKGGSKFNKPFFMAWWAHSPLLILLPIGMYMLRKENRSKSSLSMTKLVKLKGFSSAKEFLFIIIGVTFLYYLPNIGWYVALPHVSVGVCTVVFNTSTGFVYVMGIWFRNEKFDWKKLLAVLLSLFGVLIISQNSGDDSSNSSGSSNQHQEHSDTKSGFEVNTFVMVLLASAITYAIYEIAYKKYATKERDVSVAFSLYIIGWIGVASFLSGLVIMPINHFLGWETFTLPDRSVLGLLLVNAFCGLLYNLCLFFALTVLDSPLSINMAILFTIPGMCVCFVLHPTQMIWVI